MKWFTITLIAIFSCIISTRPATAAVQKNVCIDCHASQSQAVKLWQSSIHAEKGITCIACHGGDPADFANAMSPLRGFRDLTTPDAVTKLCSGCHTVVATQHMRSDHAGRGGPTCVTCHGSHNVVRASINFINKKSCSTCHSFNDARRIRRTMSKLDKMFGAIEEKIKLLKSQGIETGQFEERLFALRLRFHAMFHSLNRELIVAESEQIQAEINKTNEAGGNRTWQLIGKITVGCALLAALLIYLNKKNCCDMGI